MPLPEELVVLMNAIDGDTLAYISEGCIAGETTFSDLGNGEGVGMAVAIGDGVAVFVGVGFGVGVTV